MKIIAGEFSRAILNTSRTILGPSPKYFWTNSEPTTRMKFAVVLFATAFTSMVFPVPGGPYSRTPRGGSIPVYKSVGKTMAIVNTNQFVCKGQTE